MTFRYNVLIKSIKKFFLELSFKTFTFILNRPSVRAYISPLDLAGKLEEIAANNWAVVLHVKRSVIAPEHYTEPGAYAHGALLQITRGI